MHKALEGAFVSPWTHRCHRQHFKHASDDIWSIFSIKFSGFGLAFEEFWNKNFMAVLPARERQFRLYSKVKATQGSRPVQSTNPNHPKTEEGTVGWTPPEVRSYTLWQAQSFLSCNIFTRKHNFCRATQPTLPSAQETPLAQREDQKGSYPEKNNKNTVTLLSNQKEFQQPNLSNQIWSTTIFQFCKDSLSIVLAEKHFFFAFSAKLKRKGFFFFPSF